LERRPHVVQRRRRVRIDKRGDVVYRSRMTFAPDYALARPLPSPNHGERARPISALILHYTGVPTAQAALALLQSPEAEVSAHYLVEEDGSVLQLVPEARRAWHAGKSYWAGETDMNSASIGIEIQHPGHEEPRPYPPPQIAAVVRLARDICLRNGIRRRYVLAHSDIAITRKIDPGEFFPWEALAAGGVGLYPKRAPILDEEAATLGERGDAIDSLRSKLARFGYRVDADDESLTAAVAAFQRHFRPERIDGRADASTLAMLDRLLATMDGDT
jgi:N-acetylmuramoyl-L-alanine amidase